METLLAILVLIVVAAILIPLARRSSGRNELLSESGRMRKVYVALSLYEEQYDTQPAPNLLAATVYDPQHTDFVSELDPFAATSSKSFPMDPGLDVGEASPFRISFSYLQDFVRAGKIHVAPWAETRLNPKIGVLGNEWYGSVHAGDPFHADVSGRLLRINTDGSVYVLPDRGGPKPLGDSDDLFLKR